MRGHRFLERYNSRKRGWLHDTLKFLLLFVLVFCLFRFVIGFAIVGGPSMEPALADGEFLLYTRMAGDYQPGDIISMRVPSGEYYVKRVVAVGGDVVDLRSGIVYVNGEPLEDIWTTGETREESGAVIYPYRVREGNVFVLGDNREVSMDSRAFGEVSRRQIKGRILLRMGRWYIRTV